MTAKAALSLEKPRNFNFQGFSELNAHQQTSSLFKIWNGVVAQINVLFSVNYGIKKS